MLIIDTIYFSFAFYKIQIYDVFVGYFPSDRFDIRTNGRHRGNLGSQSQKLRTEFHTKCVRADNYRHLYSQIAAGTAMCRILRLHWLSKNVHSARYLADI